MVVRKNDVCLQAYIKHIYKKDGYYQKTRNEEVRQLLAFEVP